MDKLQTLLRRKKIKDRKEEITVQRPKGNPAPAAPQASAAENTGNAPQAKAGQEPRPNRNGRRNFRRNNEGNKRPERNTNTDVQA